jgi:hypothetical protein
LDESLGKNVFAMVQASFMDEAEKVFGFLVDEFSMSGPERSQVVLPTVSYTDGHLRCRILLEDMSVTTRLELEDDVIRRVADLDQVVRAAKLGSVNEVVRVAHTMRGLKLALQSQAEFLRKLHPLLAGATASELLDEAGARKWRVR